MQRKYFIGFNEIRAVAAIAVLIHHTELYKKRMHIPTLYNTVLRTFIDLLGNNGVSVFFTLSGFLITYLLLEEQQHTNNINVKHFYIRRILRIWPLYYIVIAIGFLVIPALSNLTLFSGQGYYNALVSGLNYKINLIFFLLFLSNVALFTFSSVAGASQTWSVSVEEQFYFVWPWVIKYVKKYLGVFLLIVIFGYYLITNSFERSSASFVYPIVKVWFYSLQLHFLAAGALAAYLYRTKYAQILKVQAYSIINVLVISLFLYHLFFDLSKLAFCFLCAYIILLTANNKSFTNKLLDKIGVYSYGIYMYHPFILYLIFGLLENFVDKRANLLLFNVTSYIAIFGCTFLISYLSYRYIEKPILNFNNYKPKVLQ